VWGGLPQFVPEGAVYIEGGVRVMKVAKLLEIPFAPAVVDFEFKNGRYYPKIGGIVVLKQSKQLIEDSFYEFSAFQEETEYEKFQQKIYDRWKKIIRLLLSRERLRETYGH
jgi:xeroderma pigmentosum group C-complementing protein